MVFAHRSFARLRAPLFATFAAAWWGALPGCKSSGLQTEGAAPTPAAALQQAAPTGEQAKVAEPGAESAKLFGRYFEQNFWGDADSRSGPGSNLHETAEVRLRLAEVLRDLEVKTFLDAACGDFFWMKEVDLSQVDYLGMDVVPALIAQNERRFGQAEPPRHFEVGHIASSDLPAVDLVLVRDVLVHQPHELVQESLRNLVRSGAKYLLTTTFPGRTHNAAITEGDWRPLNLQLPPYSLPAPLMLIDEHCTEYEGHYTDKSLGLWPIDASLLAGFADL